MNPADWSGQWRRDGLAVIISPETSCYIILPGDDRRAVDICPCCDRRLMNREAAMLVADAVYPLPAP